MNTAEKIYRNVKQFPETVQSEVLDFVLFLQHKSRLNPADFNTEERRKTLHEAMSRLQELNVFCEIENPEIWQREIRRERHLPGRES